MNLDIKPINLKINSEYSNLVNPLSDLEYEVLKNSIKEKGLHLPIIVNEKGEILDGHHRYKSCKELDIEPKIEVKSFDNLLDEKEFVIEINLKRRQLNSFQKAQQAYKLEQIEKERSRQRQLSGLKNVNSSFTPIDGNDKPSKGETADIVSKKLGISQGTYQRAKTIIEEGTEEQNKRLEQGKSKINKEYEKIKKDKKKQEFLEQFRLAYIKARFGKEISSNAYYSRKRKVDSGSYATEWLNFFSKIGFVVNHKRIIDTVEMLQKDTIRDYLIMQNSENKNPEKIRKIRNDISENCKLLQELSLGTPIIAQIKTRIENVEVFGPGRK